MSVRFEAVARESSPGVFIVAPPEAGFSLLAGGRMMLLRPNATNYNAAGDRWFRTGLKPRRKRLITPLFS